MSDNIKFDYKNLSPFKWFVLENFPFIEADFDALTEWQLFCKLGKEINKIIDSQNIVGLQAENLTNAFNNLKNYVDNYFNNLDVQEEINNKLNNMASDGTLTELIGAYVDPKLKIFRDELGVVQDEVSSMASGSPAGVYATISELQEADPDHSRIYVVLDDGAWYFWNNVTNQWKKGGVYQGTFVSDTDPTIKKIKLDIDVVSKKTYHNIQLLLRAGTLSNSGQDSINISYLNSDCRTEYFFVRKGSSIDINTVNCVVYFYNSSFEYQSQITLENKKYVFEQDSVVRLRVRGTNLNERSNVNEILTTEEEITINNYINFVACSDNSDSLEFGCGAVTTGYLGGTGKYAISKILYLEKCNLYLPIEQSANLIKINNDGTFEVKTTWSNNKYVKVNESGYYVVALYNKDGLTFDSNLYNLKIKVYDYNYINRGIKNSTQIAYHRGLSAFYPENTIPSFGAVKKYGGKYIECDVQTTSDGYMICIHDATVDRTTSGTGNVANLTLAQIQSYYVKNGYQDAMFNNTLRVPTIEDVIAFCSFNGLIPIIELKSQINYNQLITYLKNYNLYDDAIIISYSFNYLKELRDIDEHVLVGLLADNYTTEILYDVTKLGINSGIDLNVSNYNITNNNRFHNNNLFVIYFVSDDLGLKEKYSTCDYITTNRIIESDNINWNNDVMNYLISGNSFNQSYNDNEILLFQDVINISGFVKFENDQQSIIIGDQTYTSNVIGNWTYVNLTFMKRVSGNCQIIINAPFRELIIRKYKYK